MRVTEELADLIDGVTGALEAHRLHLDKGFSDSSRRGFMDDLGTAGGAYRERVYAGFTGRQADVSGDRVQALLALVRSYVEKSLEANRRSDSLYHSYNILDLSDGAAAIRRLPEMLEGQVAMLGSGQLDAQESLALLAGLRPRSDQHEGVHRGVAFGPTYHSRPDGVASHQRRTEIKISVPSMPGPA